MTGGPGPTTWLGYLKDGDSLAAQRLWEIYFPPLVRLARAKLSGAPRRMADEEDIALAAFHSFCRGVEEERFPRLDDSDDLWQILVMLTGRKAIDYRDHEMRLKRGGGAVRGESAFGDLREDGHGIDQVIGREPTPEFAAQISEQLNRLLRSLENEELRRTAMLKLEGYTNDEIAIETGCGLRTVERRLALIRRTLETESGDVL